MPEPALKPHKTELVSLIEVLAPLVWEDRQAEASRDVDKPRGERTPWYFLNVNHPIIKRLYLRYLRRSLNGSQLPSPPGDLDRVRFELALLHPAVLRELAEGYRAAGRL